MQEVSGERGALTDIYLYIYFFLYSYCIVVVNAAAAFLTFVYLFCFGLFRLICFFRQHLTEALLALLIFFSKAKEQKKWS